MTYAAQVAIAADRYTPCVRTITFRGLDLTGVALRMQVRLRGDTPGTPLIDLNNVSNAQAQGLKLVSSQTVDGLPVSVVQIRINETTIEALPYSGELGDSTALVYDMQGTLGGDKRVLLAGTLMISAGVTGADNAPLNRPFGYSPQSGASGMRSGAILTFGETRIEITIDGADLLAPSLQRALDAADEAESHLHDFPDYYVGASGGLMPSVPFTSIANQTIDPAVTLLRTTGATGGIVNMNSALSDAEIAAHPRVRTKDQAGRRFERDKYALTARQMGAGGLGQDATVPIASYQAYVQTQGHDVAGRTDPLGLIGIDLDPGSYLITSSGAFLDETFTNKRGGWGIEGHGPGTTQIVFAPTDAKKVMIHNVAYLGVQLKNFTTVCDDEDAVFFRSEARNYAGLNPQAYRVDLLGFSGAWDAIFDVLGDGNNSEWAIDGCAAGGPGTTLEASSGTFLRLRDTANGSEQQLNYWITRTKPWFDDADRFSCFVDAEAGSHIHVDMCDMSGWKRGTHFILRKSGFGAFSVSRTRAEMKTDQVKSMVCKWSGGYVSYDRFDSGPLDPYNVPRATVTHDYLCNPGPDIRYTSSKILGTMLFRQNSDPSYSNAAAYNQGYRKKQTIILDQCQFPQLDDMFDAITFASGNANGSAQPAGGLPLVRITGCRGKDESIVGVQWQASTAYAAGAVMQNGGAQYICAVAGTSASSGRGPLTKSPALADGTVTWTWQRNDPRCYLTDTLINWHMTPAADGAQERIANLAIYNGGWPSIADAPAQIILPPNALLVGAGLWLPPGATSYAGPAKLSIHTDNGALTMIDGSATTGAASAGVDLSWSGRFSVGTNLGSRCVWLDPLAGLNASIIGGRAWVRYMA